MTRPPWSDYFFGLVRATSERGTCDRGRAGAIVVRDNRVLISGYVGALRGLPHCDEIGHLFRRVTHTDGTTKEHCIRTVHAEANCIAGAAYEGISLRGGVMYCSMFPCFDCAKIIAAAGIIGVVADVDYRASADSKNMFDAFKLPWHINEEGVTRGY